MATKHFILDLARDRVVRLDSRGAATTLGSLFGLNSVLANIGLVRKLLRITDVAKVLTRALATWVGGLAGLMVDVVILMLLFNLTIGEAVGPELLNFIFGPRASVCHLISIWTVMGRIHRFLIKALPETVILFFSMLRGCASIADSVSGRLAVLLLGRSVEELGSLVGIIDDVVIDVIVIDDVRDIARCVLLHLAIAWLVMVRLGLAATLTLHEDFALVVSGRRGGVLDAVILPTLHIVVVGFLSLRNDSFVIGVSHSRIFSLLLACFGNGFHLLDHLVEVALNGARNAGLRVVFFVKNVVVAGRMTIAIELGGGGTGHLRGGVNRAGRFCDAAAVLGNSERVFANFVEVHETSQFCGGEGEGLDGRLGRFGHVMSFYCIYGLFVSKVRVVVISDELQPLGWLLIIVNPLDCTLPTLSCAYEGMDGSHLRIYECVS
jgi:hypothetical protein